MDELLELTIDDIEHQIELIKIHQKACAILEKQMAHFGCGFVPPHIQMDYDRRQEIIKELEKAIVEKAKSLSANGRQALGEQLERTMPERVIISDSANVFVNTKINAGGDIIILNISKP